MLMPCRINRRCNKDTVVNGIPIKEGCLIAIPSYYLHFKEDFWTDPEHFNPERFGIATLTDKHTHQMPAHIHKCIVFTFQISSYSL